MAHKEQGKARKTGKANRAGATRAAKGARGESPSNRARRAGATTKQRGATPAAGQAPDETTAPSQGGDAGQALLPGAAGHPAAPEQAGLSVLDELPTPDPWATAWTELDMRCPKCQIIHYVPTCTFLNARESPQLVQQLAKGRFNLKRCPLCRTIEPVDYPFTYFDPDRKLAVQVRSEWEWHAGGGEEWYAARLEDFFEKWAEHDVRIEVVFGQERLVERFLQDLPAPPARR